MHDCAGREGKMRQPIEGRDNRIGISILENCITQKVVAVPIYVCTSATNAYHH
jgi:hypothetical protein